MNTILKQTTINGKPSKFINLNSGYYYYNYNIQSEEVQIYRKDLPDFVEKYDEEGNQTNIIEGDELINVNKYSYIQVRISGLPTYEKCVEAVIRKYITSSQEFDLINSANKALYNKEDVPQEYIDYLNLLDEIKSNIKKDFEINL